MPPLHAELIGIILICSLAVAAIALLLIACSAWLRFRAVRRARRLKLFRSLITQALTAQSDARNGYQPALARLRATLRQRRRPELEQALIDCIRSTGAVDPGRRIADDLGILARWRQDLAAKPGKNGRFRFHRQPGFLTRARCASNLAAVGDRASWKVLVQALDDSHPDVQRAALRALADLREPQSGAALANWLAACSSQPRGAISQRSLRAAWGRLPPAQRADLLPLLARPDSGVRRLALDMLVQTPQANSTGELGASLSAGVEIPRSILNAIAADPDAEVRARTADLLSMMPADSAEETLRALLDDGVWFVRLHAVRAVAARRCPNGAQWIEARLTDPRWRVRECAAKALSGWGSEGLDRLLSTFQSTADVYAREQIGEALEASGRAALLNGVSGNEDRARGAAAAEGAIRKTG